MLGFLSRIFARKKSFSFASGKYVPISQDAYLVAVASCGGAGGDYYKVFFDYDSALQTQKNLMVESACDAAWEKNWEHK